MTTDQLLTVYFTTRKGNQYVYDACTNRVFFFPSPMREILERYQEQSKENLVTNLSTHWTKDYLNHCYDQIQQWIDIDKAFLARRPAETDFSLSETQYWEELLSKPRLQVILMVTENCNLRCKYCIYGDYYPFFRMHNTILST